MVIFPRLIAKDFAEGLELFPAVAVLGPRQVGKTTFVKSVLDTQHDAIYLDLEFYVDARKLEQPEMFFESNSDRLIILDEIQRMPELFPLLRVMIDRNRKPGRFVLLGSASPDLLRRSSETLAGRIIYLELSPLQIIEVQERYKREDHWLRGGFPGALQAETDRKWKLWTNSFVQTYVERDLPSLGLTGSAITIRRLLTMIASIQGGQLNTSIFARSLDLSVNTVNKYLGFLENAFLIRLLPPFFKNIGKRLVKAPKLYIRDSGILHSLTGIDGLESLSNNLLLGASWEGYVLQQIVSILTIDVSAYYYRTQNGSELDLVLVKAGMPLVAIEIRYSNAPSLKKGNIQAIDDLQTIHNYVVTPEADGYWLRRNVMVTSITSIWEHLRLLNMIQFNLD